MNNSVNNHTLHLYSSNMNKYSIQEQFLSGITKYEKAIYITNDSRTQVLKEFKGISNVTVLKPENLNKLNIFSKGLRIVVDGRSIINPLLIEKKLNKLSKENLILCTYPVGKMNSDIIKELVTIHEKLILTTEDKTILSSSNFDKLNLSEESLEKFVKNYLEMVILALIRKRPMCGTDIIKTIHKDFNVLLSPAAVYPCLHTLMENGLLKCDYVIKKKIYKHTEIAKNKIKNMFDEHLQTNKLFVQLLCPDVSKNE